MCEFGKDKYNKPHQIERNINHKSYLISLREFLYSHQQNIERLDDIRLQVIYKKPLTM